ncbi:MAG: NACHT domain-containing protein [Pseudonocardiaceae bacterium]
MGMMARADPLPYRSVRRRRLFLVAVAGVQLPVTLLLGFATNMALAQHRWPVWLELVRTHPWHSLAALEAVTVCLAMVVSMASGRDQRVDDPDMEMVTDRLAVAVKRQWNAEAELRHLNDPFPMPVRWDPADPDVVADWPALVRLATTGPGWPRPPGGTWANDPVGLTGTDNDLVDVLDRVPTRRLVVLGEPGAGKTILLVRLVLDLLSRRRPGDPVPVLLPLASWNPEDQDLRSWIVGRLITDHSALAEPASGGTVIRAQVLLDKGLILPVLDGLDEIPDAVRGSALARINDAMRSCESLVLAARTAEYRSAVCSPDGVEVLLTGAAGITLRPLDVTVVSDYLRGSAGGLAAAARWDKVLSTFTADRPSPVAQALTTPLRVVLARAIYNPRPGETLATVARQPAELLDPALFPTPKEIERHLFDIFIPAAYRPHPDRSRRCPWTADQAGRWLAFLARDLEDRQNGTTDLAWWKLSGAAPRPLAGISVGLVAGLAGALGFPFPMDLGLGLISALVAGLLVRTWVRRDRMGLTNGRVGGLLGGLLGALAALAVFGAGVGNLHVGSLLAGILTFGIAVASLSRFFAALVGGFVGDFVAAFLHHASLVPKIGVTVGPVALLINGLGFWLAAGLAVGLADRSAPARELRWSPAGFGYGLACGLVIGFVVWIQIGSTGGLVIGLVSMVVGGYSCGIFTVMPADLTKAATPRVVLVRDRAIFRSTCLGLGLWLGLISVLVITFILNSSDGLPNGFRIGLRVGLATFIVVGISFGFLQACWGSFALARSWLAASGHLPWRLMTFLDDAHARGVLRQVGAVYQFRHVELQRRLASDQQTFTTPKSEQPCPSC